MTIEPNATDAQLYGHDALGAVAALTRDLRHLADRLDLIAQQLERGDGRATEVAAELVNDYTQGTGSAGTRLWTLVRNAADADRHFRAVRVDDEPRQD